MCYEPAKKRAVLMSILTRPRYRGFLGIFALSSSLALVHCGGDDTNSGAAPAPEPGPNDDAGPVATPEPPTPGADYLIVTADTLAASAEHFKAYRESTGHKVAVRTVSSIVVPASKKSDVAAQKIHDFVKAQYEVRADKTKPFFLLLLGDATEDETFGPADVPAGHYVDKDDDTTTITTDNVYADVDGDHLPDLAVGRVPVATDAEADGVLGRTKAYEATYEPGLWNRRLSLFASTSGFGEPVDSTIEGFVFKMVEELPYDFDLTLTYAKQTSPYVYIPEKFSDKVYERLNEGSLMMAYVGHGDTTGFTTLDWNGGSFPIFDTKKLPTSLDIAHKPPILTLIACLTGRFTEGESVSESLLKSSHGPVAVLSSTQISHPYPNAIFIREIAKALTASPAKIPTAGELFVSAKQRSIKNNDELRKEIDSQVGALVPSSSREILKRTHLYMYTLFGDPALRIAYPKGAADITLGAASAKPGVDVSVSATIGGVTSANALVTLESTRSTIVGEIKPVPADGTPNRDEVIQANYATANDRALVKKTVAITNGKLEGVTLTIPQAAPAGTYYVKVYADDGKVDALGSKPLTITAN